MRFVLAVAVFAIHSFGGNPNSPTGPGPTRARARATRSPGGGRAAILRSVLIQNPLWTVPQFAAVVGPSIQAAGLRPYSNKALAEQILRLRKLLDLPILPSKVVPEHIAYLKAQFSHNHKQTSGEVYAKFRAKFGPAASTPSRVAGWWHHARHRLYYTPASGIARPSPSPTMTSAAPADHDDDTWDLNEAFDKFLN